MARGLRPMQKDLGRGFGFGNFCDWNLQLAGHSMILIYTFKETDPKIRYAMQFLTSTRGYKEEGAEL